MKITWTNMEELDALVSNQTRVETDMALRTALMAESQIMFAASQRIVPVATGTLRRSGIILPPRSEGNHIVVEMGYGGAASAYALKQHEDLNLRHAEGKAAKYLENPVRERVPNLELRIAGRMNKILGGF
jgi:hypothetical protein